MKVAVVWQSPSVKRNNAKSCIQNVGRTDISQSMGPFRVVILYSGRWFGLAARHWVDNHVSISFAQHSALAKCGREYFRHQRQWCAGKEIKRVEEVQTEAQSMWGHAVPARDLDRRSRVSN